MKNYRNVFLLFVAFLILAITGCQVMEAPTEPGDDPVNTIILKVNGVQVTDNITLEKGVANVFTIYVPRLKSVTTTFHDNNTVKTGTVVAHTFSTTLNSSSFTVTAVDSSNVVHEKTYQVTLVYNINLPIRYNYGKNSVGNGKYEHKILFLKAVLDGYTGSYAYIGTVTDPQWVNTPVPAADTNKVLKNGVVSDAPSGERGKYFSVKLTLSPGNYVMAAMKGGIWGAYGDSNKVRFSIDTNGDFAWGDMNNSSLPGEIGDDGTEPVTRFQVSDPNKVIIFVNNFKNITNSSFVRMQDTTGVFQTPLVQAAVDNQPAWGKLEIPASSIPASGTLKLSFNYGDNISSPLSFNPMANKSTFYYKPERVIKVIIQKVGLGKSANGQVQYWRISQG